ncbi:hypothetical protein CDAR_170871 [Caerostris darwini]|uniref:Uncharacterized protein n=1 Tax=Caerostris darwini TaxID=1538125 RepID=A0AAV4P8V5_9ARAC|nr:hypothetical protein CDAR_170871 [Caerostris darwini]
MFFDVVICAFIGIVAVLAILGLWRKKYSRFVPDNKHSAFKVLVDVMDSILFVTSGKKNALHVMAVPSGKRKGSCSLLASTAQRIPRCHQRACAEIGRDSARAKISHALRASCLSALWI